MDMRNLGIKDVEIKKRCYLILDNLKITIKEDIERLSYDEEIILGMLEISLYPQENVEYGVLATDFICTNIVLNSIIRISNLNNSFNNSIDYNDGLEFEYKSQSNIEYSLNTDSDSYSYSDSEMEMEFETEKRGIEEYKEFMCNQNNKGKCDKYNKYGDMGRLGDEDDIEYIKGFNLDLDIEKNKNIVKKNKEYPISVLIKFISNYFDINSCYYMNYNGMYNYCRIIYSLLLVNFEWTLINILYLDESYILNNLVLSLNHESVINLLKIIIIVICEYNKIIKFELTNRKVKHSDDEYFNKNSVDSINYNVVSYSTSFTSHKINTINNNNIGILTKLLIFNLRIYDNDIKEFEYINNNKKNYIMFDNYNKSLIINKTSSLLNEIINNTLDINNVINYFKYNIISDNVNDSPLSSQNKLSKWLISITNKNSKLYNKKKNSVFCFQLILSISSKEIISELMDLILFSIKKFTINDGLNVGCLYYSDSFKCSLSVINSILNYSLNSLLITDMNSTLNYNNNDNIHNSFNNKYIKIIGNIKKFIFVRNKSELDFSGKFIFEFERNMILNWKLSNNIIIPITKTYISEIIAELYYKNAASHLEGTEIISSEINIIDERKECIVTILIEFFNYIGIALIKNHLESVNRLLSEISKNSNFPIIFEIFDTIIFNDTDINGSDDDHSNINIKINNENKILVEDTVYYLFKICINNINYNKIKDIKNNISLNARLLFIYQYLNSSFIYNLSKLNYSQVNNVSSDETLSITGSNKNYPDMRKIFSEHIINRKFLDSRMLKRVTNNNDKNSDRSHSGVIFSFTNDSQNITSTKNANIKSRNVASSNYNTNFNNKKIKYNIPRIPKALLNEIYPIRKDIFESSNITIIERIYQK
ncbi:hypothetical protein FG386_001552 [Cryptosporidium ryanae]|uniref:uncharacterized protein n=1 Tax=Cryptosporidium ryanae TaxID=515981 RepID=UPI00351AA7F7|nr:hypothetical protein FG386_001552 [Cryptosporidium ryanae]